MSDLSCSTAVASHGASALTLDLHQAFSAGLTGLWLQALVRAEQPNLFQHPAWHSAYYQALDATKATSTEHSEGTTPRCIIGVVSDAQGPAAILPFTLTTRREHGLPLRVLELMRPCDMGVRDLIIAPELDPATLWRPWLDALASAGIGWDMIDCSDALAGSDALRFAEAAPRPVNCYYHHDSNRLANTGAAAQQRIDASRSHLKKTRRKANALAKLGSLDYQLVDDAEGLQQALASYVAVEDSGWKGSEGHRTSMRHDHGQHAFYKTLLNPQQCAGLRPVAAVLSLDGQPIAVKLCVEIGDTLFMLKIAYADSHRDHSPGNVLLSWLLDQYASRDDIAHVSFITAGDWTLRWHPQRQAAHVVTLYNHSARGLVAAAAARLIGTARALKRRRSTAVAHTETAAE